jgi:mRNA interferase RelE/StbE
LEACRRQLKGLGPEVKAEILAYMRENVVDSDDPCDSAKALTGRWSGHWRYRIGTYRVICKMRNREMVVMAVKAGHRGDVYN